MGDEVEEGNGKNQQWHGRKIEQKAGEGSKKTGGRGGPLI
jgi:hypothetical protein